MTKILKKGPAFLLKTYDMLEKQQFKEIIDWIPDGTGFVVKSPTQLAQKVLPKYFKHSNMHSFIRQLNMYGFNKKRGSKTQNYYFHRLFHKGQRDMIAEMQRKAQKKGTHKQIPKESEPHEDVSIEVQEREEQSHDQNKENKSLLLPSNLASVQSRTRQNSQLEQNNMKKSLVEMTALNKVLLLEQVYHLANIQSNNLLIYHEQMQEDQDENDRKCERRDVVERFRRVKNQYLKIHSLIWDKASPYVKVHENELVKSGQAQSKDEKPTQVEINNNREEPKQQSKQEMIHAQVSDLISEESQKQEIIEEEVLVHSNN